jgi:DNA polymerase-3 subunit gamma/tau
MPPQGSSTSPQSIRSPATADEAKVPVSEVPPLTEDGPLAIRLNWEQFQEEVAGAFPNIAPFLEMGRLVSIDGHVVTIGFTKQATVARAMIEKPDNTAALTSTCERLSGQAIRLRIVEFTESDAPGPTMAQLRVAKEKEQRLVLFEQARAHPVVKQALEMFGAELADVRPLSSQKEGER